MEDRQVEAVGLPAALKAWRAREPDPLLTMHCGAPDCGAEVGAVFRTAKGPVVESRMHPLEGEDPPEDADPSAVADRVAGLGADLGFVGLVDEFTGPDGRGSWLTEPVRAQVDLLRSEIYWQDPAPSCPRHGALRVDQAGLAEAVSAGQDRYVAAPR